jgi:hypothetical protein
MVQGVERSRLYNNPHDATAETGYTVLTQLSLSTHQLVRDETYTYITLAFIQIDNMVEYPLSIR